MSLAPWYRSHYHAVSNFGVFHPVGCCHRLCFVKNSPPQPSPSRARYTRDYTLNLHIAMPFSHVQHLKKRVLYFCCNFVSSRFFLRIYVIITAMTNKHTGLCNSKSNIEGTLEHLRACAHILVQL